MFASVGIGSLITYLHTGHPKGWTKGYVQGQIDAMEGKFVIEKHVIPHSETVQYVTTQPDFRD
jgi:hypothetical protein